MGATEPQTVMGLMIATLFVQNVVLSQFLGLCPFVGASNHSRNAFGLALATTLVLTLVAAITYPVFHYLLEPFNLQYLKTLVLIFIIATSVQLLELSIKWLSPLLHKTLGLYLPLITSNCAVLGVALLVVAQDFQSWVLAIAFGASAGMGFALTLLLFTLQRQQLHTHKMPLPFRGSPIALITAGIMSLALFGLKGLA